MQKRPTETEPTEREKLLADIDRLLAEANDDASRRDLERLRESLNSPEMLDMARALETTPKRAASELVLHFHVPMLPMWMTATFSVLASAMCLYAATLAWSHPVVMFGSRSVNLWLIAALFGAISLVFTALSFRRSFFVRVDSEGMVTRHGGRRFEHLHVGMMRWKDIRGLHERARDRVLEVRSAGGEIFEIPMRLVNYPILRHHLDNMVMLYGDRSS
jgi:hypothetical protein